MKSSDKTYPSEQSVTINCDASFDPKSKRGGYAFWISYNDGKIVHHGEFKESTKCSTQAEIKSLCNAFAALYQFLVNDSSPLKKDIRLVFVNCDNQTVRDIIKNRTYPKKFKTEVELLLKYSSRFELVIAKPIRGHQKGDSPRQWVNNWCDEHSRKYLQK